MDPYSATLWIRINPGKHCISWRQKVCDGRQKFTIQRLNCLKFLPLPLLSNIKKNENLFSSETIYHIFIKIDNPWIRIPNWTNILRIRIKIQCTVLGSITAPVRTWACGEVVSVDPVDGDPLGRRVDLLQGSLQDPAPPQQ